MPRRPRLLPSSSPKVVEGMGRVFIEAPDELYDVTKELYKHPEIFRPP